MVLWLTGCGGDAPFEPLEPGARVLAFGDSLTAGTGAPAGRGYPDALRAATGLDVRAAGVPGETTAGGAKRFADALDEHRPELVILLEGGNDFLRGVPASQTEANLRRMLNEAQQRSIGVYLVAVPRPGLLLSTDPLYERLGEEFEVPVDTSTLVEILRDARLKSDPVHPNAAGYARMAESIADGLRSTGAL
ncbi:MAG: arylesterase [Chromatiales bacterium]|nr:arylesterase [Chromatiales bacterium]